MLAARVRSGLDETSHLGAVAVSDAEGTLLASSGDIDRPFFIRSSAKPFQAYVSQTAGADLSPLELAQACSSHRGFPVHIAMVSSMLDRAGLGPSDLRCPPDWPSSETARDMLIAAGQSQPKSILHNCSGKHAGFLRACVANGWPLDTYLDPGHPLQERIADFVTELGEFDARPVGVDGCGAPVLRTTARSMALLFARLSTDSRFSEVRTAMHRYPALIAANSEPDTEIAIATNSVSKGGAQGCLGVAHDSGIGLAVKSWDGLGEVAGVGAVAALDALGLLSDAGRESLSSVASPALLGGGRNVGSMEPRLVLHRI